MTSFSEFYQRSINEPEQFWAEQARRIDWQTPFTQTLDHRGSRRLPVGFVKAVPTVPQRLSSGRRNNQRRWRSLPSLRKQKKSAPLPFVSFMTK
ncbi:acetyl-coenzyme A synthetase N-terminal domain-containing protein [Escherichia coli]